MKNNTLFLILLIPAILLMAYTEGPPAGYTGSPLDGQSCNECHGGIPGNLPGWISTNIPSKGYVPGETYTVAVTGIGLVAVKMGFQVTSENQSEKAGTFLLLDPVRTQLKGSTTVTHTEAGTEVTQLPASWMMRWIAPPAGTGDITFYSVVNQTNNDNTVTGDLIFASSLVVSEAFVGVSESFDERELLVYPNPCDDVLRIRYQIQDAGYQIIELYSIAGNRIQTMLDNQMPAGEHEIDISDLPDGVYFVRMQTAGSTAIRKLVVAH